MSPKVCWHTRGGSLGSSSSNWRLKERGKGVGGDLLKIDCDFHSERERERYGKICDNNKNLICFLYVLSLSKSPCKVNGVLHVHYSTMKTWRGEDSFLVDRELKMLCKWRQNSCLNTMPFDGWNWFHLRVVTVPTPLNRMTRGDLLHQLLLILLLLWGQTDQRRRQTSNGRTFN